MVPFVLGSVVISGIIFILSRLIRKQEIFQALEWVGRFSVCIASDDPIINFVDGSALCSITALEDTKRSLAVRVASCQ